MTKIFVVNFSDSRGGAAIAARKQFSLIKNKYNVRYVVAEKNSSELDVFGPNKFSYYVHFFLRCLSLLLCQLQWSSNKTKHSINVFSSPHVVTMLDDEVDIIHLHWVNNETISLLQLNSLLQKFDRRFLITLHDDWFFCGAEHSSLDSTRFIDGYLQSNKNVKGLDLDRWVFNRKLNLKTALKMRGVIFTAPSLWMVKRAKSSFLLKDLTVKYLPNIIDVDIFKSVPTECSRSFLSIPMDRLVICFGAIGGTSNYHKGYDLLIDALNELKKVNANLNIHLLVFGGKKSSEQSFLGFNVTYTGHVNESSYLARIYSAADVVVVPSRIESFGQVAAESLACETPVVCFNNSAVAEIVEDGLSGFTAEAFSVSDLTSKLIKILSLSSEERHSLGEYGRNSIRKRYSSEVVLPILDDIYNVSSNK
ncbi:glycosyltransferase [Shewanella oncorhynchi]|uniref:glycosyltransferase n=1 Tax=Shewanella oncorhynchi TaxID=2726434 RepID=UPI003D7AFF45